MDDAQRKKRRKNRRDFPRRSGAEGDNVRKRQPTADPKLEAALDELDEVLTADAISKILEGLPEADRPFESERNLLPPADRPERRDKRKR
jgi:hypothetical protein